MTLNGIFGRSLDKPYDTLKWDINSLYSSNIEIKKAKSNNSLVIIVKTTSMNSTIDTNSQVQR